MPIVASIMTASAVRSGRDGALGRRIEKAMADAAAQALADGITDPAEQKARMLEAREIVKLESQPAPAEPPADPQE